MAHNTFFVDPLGSDSFPGTTQLTPWRTIQHAMDSALEGSSIFIKAGVYNEKLTMNVSGLKGHTIEFLPFEDDIVIVDGTGLPGTAMIQIHNKSYITIFGLHIRNNTVPDAQGILIDGFCEWVSIYNNKISNIHFSDDPTDTVNSTTNSQPLIVYGSVATKAISNLNISGNEIFDCRTGFSEALAVNGNVNTFEVSNNIVHDISNIGIDIIGHEGTSSDSATDQARNGIVSGNVVYNCISPYATAAGIYIDGGKDIVVERNIVYQNQWGIEVGCENTGRTTSGIIVRNNFVYNNASSGIAIGGFEFPGGSGAVVDCKVINNSLFNNDTEDQWVGELTLTYSEQVEIKNNIFYATNTNGQILTLDSQSVVPVNLILDNNIWFLPAGSNSTEVYWNGVSYPGFSSYQTGTNQDANSSFVNPEYKSLSQSTLDLHISTTSPAYNTGDASVLVAAGSTDIDNEGRAIDGNIDIGADEYNFGTFLEQVLATPKLEVFPNPATDGISIIITDLLTKNAKLLITSSSGKPMHLAKIVTGNKSHKIKVDVRQFKPGLYYAKLIDDTNAIAYPFIVVR